MSMKKLGKVTIKANGEVIESYPGAEIDIGGTMRKDKENGHHPGHFSEEQKPCNVKAQFDIGPSSSLRAMEAMSDVTLICELDTGQSYVGSHCYVVEVPSFTDGSSGKVEVEFKGPPMEEMNVV